ncbi:MAG: aminoglycoside phosphotransferase family protein [Erysipelotrichales bacterium]|nr:aminoglycoside phosphotransferase family protein [Erysipelotrichales bacterium]
MKNLKLLLILPNLENSNILICKSNKIFTYSDLVEENVGFDNPQSYNDYFKEMTNISVYRKYSFNTTNYAVFVFELAEKNFFTPNDDFEWVTYDDFLSNCADEELMNIIRSIDKNYNHSTNMSWLTSKGFSAYFSWLKDYLDKNNLIITGEIKQLKNAYVSTVFALPTNIGKLYMKIPGKIFINELNFTNALGETGLIKLPNFIAFDKELNIILMTDMQGYDLSDKSEPNIYRDVIMDYAKIQKASIRYLPLKHKHYDSTILTTIKKLDGFSHKVSKVLQDSKYELSREESEQLSKNIEIVKPLLEQINKIAIPNTLHHGDLRPGNIRVIDNAYMFYDWAWSGVSHPFLEIASFLHIVRRELNESEKEIIINQYLIEWLDYGTYEELKEVWGVIASLKNLFFAIIDYDWIESIIYESEHLDLLSSDWWLLEKRRFYLSNVIKRFIHQNFDI